MVDDVRRAMACLAAVDRSGVPPGEVAEAVVAMERARSVLGVAQLPALRRLEESGHCAEQGFRSVRAWLAHHARISPAAAGRRAADARAATRMPLVARAAASGGLTLEHLGILRRAWSPERSAASAEMEATFVDLAVRHPPAVLERTVRYWADAIDPLAGDATTAGRRRRRAVHLSRCVDGMGRLDGDLDPEGFAVVAGELGRLERQLFDDDWKAARAGHGSATTAPSPPRPGRSGWRCGGQRIVFDAEGHVLDFGRRKRFFDGGLRQAMELRDRTCAEDGWTCRRCTARPTTNSRGRTAARPARRTAACAATRSTTSGRPGPAPRWWGNPRAGG
jgi:hypothetical protein